MKHTANYPDPAALPRLMAEDQAATNTAAAAEAGAGLLRSLRGEVVSAGMGQRLANTWRLKVYPEGGRTSLEPSIVVWTKAPKIIDAFSRGVTIYPTGGRRYIAIPTNNVPPALRGSRARGQRLMTPEEVEVAFNQDLIIRNGRMGRRLAFVSVVQGRSSRRGGYRQATARRVAQGREVKLVLMFTLVPSAQLPKKLNPARHVDEWGGRFRALVGNG